MERIISQQEQHNKLQNLKTYIKTCLQLGDKEEAKKAHKRLKALVGLDEDELSTDNKDKVAV